MDKKLLDILVCPVTHTKLILSGEELISKQAKLAFPIRDGIPMMLTNVARKISYKELENF